MFPRIAYSPDYVSTPLNTTTSTGMSVEMKEVWDKKMLKDVAPNLVYDKYASKRPFPGRNGKSIEFRRWVNLKKATAPITEGVTPAGQKLEASNVTARLYQYGGWIPLTDVLDMTALDDVNTGAQERLARQATISIDAITRDVVTAGTNKIIVPARAANGTETATLTRGAITSANKVKMSDFLDATAMLRGQNAPTINGHYVAIIHPFIERDLFDDPDWREWCKSQHADKMIEGEIGVYGDILFVRSSEAKVYGADGMFGDVVPGYGRTTLNKAASAATTVYPQHPLTDEDAAKVNAAIANGSVFSMYIGGKKYQIASVLGGAVGTSSITINPALTVSEGASITADAGAAVYGGDGASNGDSVFASMVIADEAYAVSELAGGGLEYIMKPLGYGNDPLNQRSSAGWKASRAVCRLDETRMIRIESGCAKMPTAAAN